MVMKEQDGARLRLPSACGGKVVPDECEEEEQHQHQGAHKKQQKKPQTANKVVISIHMFRENRQTADRCCLETTINQSEEPHHTRIHLSCSSGDLLVTRKTSTLLASPSHTRHFQRAFRKRTEKTHTFFPECVCRLSFQ